MLTDSTSWGVQAAPLNNILRAFAYTGVACTVLSRGAMTCSKGLNINSRFRTQPPLTRSDHRFLKPHLVMGVPARVRRPLTGEELAGLRTYAQNYYEYKETYLQELEQAGEGA